MVLLAGHNFAGAGQLARGHGLPGIGGHLSVSLAASITRGSSFQLRASVRAISGPVEATLENTLLTLNGVDVLGDLNEAALSPNLAVTPQPGSTSGPNQTVTALSASIPVGTLCELAYEVGQQSDYDTIYPPGSKSPFSTGGTPFRTKPGIHRYFVTSLNSNTEAALYASGNGEILWVSVRRVEWTYDIPASHANEPLAIEITRGGETTGKITTYVPEPGKIFVRPGANRFIATGAVDAPFATIADAEGVAQPGDTIYLRPGFYGCVQWGTSGTADNRITITTLPGEENLAIIEGDLAQHVEQGGDGIGVPDNQNDNIANRDGIYMAGVRYVDILNVSIRNVWRGGVFIIGGAIGVEYGQIRVDGCIIENTGASGITALGQSIDRATSSSGAAVAADDTVARLADLVFENNDISKTNLATKYRPGGGVVEGISVGGGVSNVITRFNDIHDTEQYGIDYKAGVRGGAIHGNRLWNIEKVGIYIDSGSRWVSDIDIYDNEIWNCQAGIVLAREAAPPAYYGSGAIGDYADAVSALGAGEFIQELARIRGWNNRASNCGRNGIGFNLHPGDGPNGIIEDIQFRFNTIWNAAQEDGFQDVNLDAWDGLGLATGVEFIGCIVARASGAVTGIPGTVPSWLAIDDNFVGGDPGFADVTAVPPDLSPGAGPAIGIVTDTRAASPFNLDGDGVSRVRGSGQPADAGSVHSGITLRDVVFPLGGQSNMVGRAVFDDGAPYPPGTLQYGDSDDTLKPATPPLDHHDEVAGDMGLCIQFAIDYKAANPTDRIVFVPRAQGGTSFDANQWNPGDSLYNALVNDTNALMTANPGFVLGGILWHQGESDADTPAPYKAALTAMINDMRDDIDDAGETTPFIMGELAAGDAGRVVISGYINEVGAELPYTTVASSSGLTLDDAVHFDAASYRTFGSRYFTSYEAALVDIPSVPDAPTSLVATAGVGQVVLTWTAPADDGGGAITDYVVERSSGAGFAVVADGVSATTGYTDTGLTGGTEYTYRVSATNSAGTGAVSNTDSATPSAATAPGAPTGLTATAGDEEVDLSWTAPASDGGSAITDYVIERDSGSGYSTISDGTSTSTTYTDTGLTNDTEYTYRVSAVNGVGTGTASATDSATPEASVSAEAGAAAHWLFGSDNATNADLVSSRAASGPAHTQSTGYITSPSGTKQGLDSGIVEADAQTMCFVFRLAGATDSVIGGTLLTSGEGTSDGISPYTNSDSIYVNARGAANEQVSTDAAASSNFVFVGVSKSATAGDLVYLVGNQSANEVFTTNDPSSTSTRNVGIGNLHYNSAGLSGQIDMAECIIFNSAKTQSELDAIYQRSVTRLAARSVTVD